MVTLLMFAKKPLTQPHSFDVFFSLKLAKIFLGKCRHIL